MASNDYRFVTRWRVPATPEEISDVLSDATDLARWWPAVYLDVRVDEPGDPATGVGQLVSLWTKGWLPYTLRWSFRVTESRRPSGFTIDALGDFVGRGIWTLEPAADAGRGGGPGSGRSARPLTLVTYDWRIRAEKGVLRRFSWLVKPIFAANHRWAMARGEESLRIELARRHAERLGDPTILAALPPPPLPTFPHNLASVRRLGHV